MASHRASSPLPTPSTCCCECVRRPMPCTGPASGGCHPTSARIKWASSARLTRACADAAYGPPLWTGVGTNPEFLFFFISSFRPADSSVAGVRERERECVCVCEGKRVWADAKKGGGTQFRRHLLASNTSRLECRDLSWEHTTRRSLAPYLFFFFFSFFFVLELRIRLLPVTKRASLLPTTRPSPADTLRRAAVKLGGPPVVSSQQPCTTSTAAM